MQNNLPAQSAGTIKIGSFEVCRMGFGAMRITGNGIWGEPDDVDYAKAVLKRAVELGINFIDTADAYGPEISENLIHDALHPYEGLVIATKGGMVRGGPNDWSPNGHPDHLREACEASLKRLEVNQIAVYQFHRPDPEVPFKESLQTFIDLKREGKVKHIGLSNVSLDQLKTALEQTEIVSVQNYYNFEHRRDSESVLQLCEAQGIAFIPYFPIGGGRHDLAKTALQDIAQKHQATERQIALAWLLEHSKVMLPIPGTGSLDHLEENVKSAAIKLDDDDMTAMDRLSDL